MQPLRGVQRLVWGLLAWSLPGPSSLRNPCCQSVCPLPLLLISVSLAASLHLCLLGLTTFSLALALRLSDCLLSSLCLPWKSDCGEGDGV